MDKKVLGPSLDALVITSMAWPPTMCNPARSCKDVESPVSIATALFPTSLRHIVIHVFQKSDNPDSTRVLLSSAEVADYLLLLPFVLPTQ